MAKTTFKEAALRAVAILGLIAILLLGAWGIIQLAFFISSLFNNAGGAVSTVTTPVAHETITTNIPADATAGTPVTIGWNHQGGSGDYSFALSYSCVSGVTFKAPLPTGASQSVPCDTPFNYTQAENSLSITPVYAGTTDAKVTVTIVATNLSSGAVTAQASGTMTVHPKAIATTPAKTTTTKTSSTGKKSSSGAKTTYVASSRSHTNLYGYPDLQVTITSAYSQNGNGVLQFVIQNVGTNVTPANWTFLATLPSGYQYPSGAQQALYPGDKIVYSMGYSDYGSSAYGYDGYGYNPSGPSYVGQAYNPWNNCGGAYGYGCAATPGYARTESVSVTVDPYNQITEAFKGNNTASATFPAY